MFFVVSTGRCGSKSIANLLNQSSECVCVHEAKPRLIAEATRYLYGELSHEEAVALLHETRAPVRDGKVYGESNHKLSLLIPAIRDAFPEAKFVWLIRDARDTVASMYARRWYHGEDFRDNAAEDIMEWERWRINAYRLGAMSRPEWCALDSFARCCWHWGYKNRLIARTLQEHKCDWMLIRLEELGYRAHELFQFLQIEAPSKIALKHLNKAHYHMGHVPANWESWDPEKVVAFERFCAVGMNEWYPRWQQEVRGIWTRPQTCGEAWIWAKHQGSSLIRRTTSYEELRRAYRKGIEQGLRAEPQVLDLLGWPRWMVRRWLNKAVETAKATFTDHGRERLAAYYELCRYTGFLRGVRRVSAESTDVRPETM